MSHTIGYIYEADIHCPACARRRFGDAALNNPNLEDSEGNPVGAIASWMETSPAGEYCGDCGDMLAAPYDTDEEDAKW